MQLSKIAPGAIAAAIALTACAGGGDVPSSDPEGMVTFACSLADQDVPWEERDLVPEGAGLPVPYAIAGLLGALTAVTMEGYEEFADPGAGIVRASTSVDVDAANDEREAIVHACHEGGIATTAATGMEEQVAFACSLAGEVRRSEEPIEQWARPGSDDGFLFAATASVATLLGQTHVGEASEYEDLHAAGLDLMNGINRIDYAGISEHLADITNYCG